MPATGRGHLVGLLTESPQGRLNPEALKGWSQWLNELGQAMKTSFKLPRNPVKNSQAADEWERCRAEYGLEIDCLTRALADAKGVLSHGVYGLFPCTPEVLTAKLLATTKQHQAACCDRLDWLRIEHSIKKLQVTTDMDGDSAGNAFSQHKRPCRQQTCGRERSGLAA